MGKKSPKKTFLEEGAVVIVEEPDVATEEDAVTVVATEENVVVVEDDDVAVEGEDVAVGGGGVTDDGSAYTRDDLTWSLDICTLLRGNMPDLRKASTSIDGRITSSHVDLKMEQKFFVMLVLGLFWL